MVKTTVIRQRYRAIHEELQRLNSKHHVARTQFYRLRMGAIGIEELVELIEVDLIPNLQLLPDPNTFRWDNPVIPQPSSECGGATWVKYTFQEVLRSVRGNPYMRQGLEL